MQYYRCKCGNATAWTSMGVPECSRCSKCGSDLAQSPAGHSEPTPHEFTTRYDHHTGAPYDVCKTCHRLRSELAEDGEAEGAQPESKPGQ